VCFYLLYNFCLKHFSFWAEMTEMWSHICINLHVKCPLFWSDFNETWFVSTYFRKISNKFQETLSDVTCGRMDIKREMTKLRVAFQNFANAPKNGIFTQQTNNLTISWCMVYWSCTGQYTCLYFIMYCLLWQDLLLIKFNWFFLVYVVLLFYILYFTKHLRITSF
jgi:hypothetical protein